MSNSKITDIGAAAPSSPVDTEETLELGHVETTTNQLASKILNNNKASESWLQLANLVSKLKK